MLVLFSKNLERYTLVSNSTKISDNVLASNLGTEKARKSLGIGDVKEFFYVLYISLAVCIIYLSMNTYVFFKVLELPPSLKF